MPGGTVEGPPAGGHSLTVLGIETSCDETAAAVVVREPSGRGCPVGRILSNVVLSQFDLHKIYGGVVPEIAARAHTECLDDIVAAALREAGVQLSDVDGIAAASGPGLIGGLIVGAISGKALALAAGQTLFGHQSSGGSCADRWADGWHSAALLDAARLRRAYAIAVG